MLGLGEIGSQVAQALSTGFGMQVPLTTALMVVPVTMALLTTYYGTTSVTSYNGTTYYVLRHYLLLYGAPFARRCC